jgi:predicted PurR-regulated permease PerM
VSAANNTQRESSSRTIELGRTAAATAVAIGMVALAALAIDVFLLLFIGVAVAAALQPLHVTLCRWASRRDSRCC